MSSTPANNGIASYASIARWLHRQGVTKLEIHPLSHGLGLTVTYAGAPLYFTVTDLPVAPQRRALPNEHDHSDAAYASTLFDQQPEAPDPTAPA
jgi:hypothetical protein